MELLSSSVIGQPHAIAAVKPYVDLFNTGLSVINRPVGVIMLAGETGTGKTYFVQQLANQIHGDENHLIRIDCTEYQLDHEVAKLIGAPPGYLGHRETTPRFGTTRLRNATSDASNLVIVLFDEIEKASPALHQLLLGVFDTGRLTLGDGNTVTLQNALIFMTTNLGAKAIRSSQSTPFAFTRTQDNCQNLARNSINKFFAPEFLNRIDETIIFNSLTQFDFKAIVELEFGKILLHVHEKYPFVNIKVSTDVIPNLQQQCRIHHYGGREIKRFLHKTFLLPFAQKIAEVKNGEIDVSYDDGLVFTGTSRVTASTKIRRKSA